jgi:uncharacterized LabA/DUF88 family protein
MSAMTRVRVLVDWDTTRRIVPTKHNDARDVENVFEKLRAVIANYLSDHSKQSAYRVHWRIYHGWHQGKTKTADRLLFEKFVQRATAQTVNRVSFSTNFEYSENLCCGSRRTPIFDTLRADRYTGELKQKMVDTILACDLLHLARSKQSELLMLVADDDDFVPALFTAEAWNARVVWLHFREQLSSMLNLTGLTGQARWQ